MTTFILDTWAIIAWLKRQKPASERTRELLKGVERGDCRLLINIVNVGEIFYVCAKARNIAYSRRVLQVLQPRLTTISASDELVMMAVSLKAKYPISYADGFAAATAITVGAPLVTGDPELAAMASVEKTLRLEWIGRPN